MEVPEELFKALSKVLKAFTGAGKSDRSPFEDLFKKLLQYANILKKNLNAEQIGECAFD